MAVYEFRCRTCDARFEQRRAMADADAPATCPNGHVETVRLLSMFASVGSAGAAAPSGGGCCGGACGCG